MMLVIKLLVLVNQCLMFFQCEILGHFASILFKIAQEVIELVLGNTINDISKHLQQTTVAVVGKVSIGLLSQSLGS